MQQRQIPWDLLPVGCRKNFQESKTHGLDLMPFTLGIGEYYSWNSRFSNLPWASGASALRRICKTRQRTQLSHRSNPETSLSNLSICAAEASTGN